MLLQRDGLFFFFFSHLPEKEKGKKDKFLAGEAL